MAAVPHQNGMLRLCAAADAAFCCTKDEQLRMRWCINVPAEVQGGMEVGVAEAVNAAGEVLCRVPLLAVQ